MGKGTEKTNGCRRYLVAAACCILAGTSALTGCLGKEDKKPVQTAQTNTKPTEAPAKPTEAPPAASEEKLACEFDGMKLWLPGSWKDKYEVKDEAEGRAFYHKASLEAGTKAGETGCGALFWLKRTEGFDFGHPDQVCYLVGNKDKVNYYMTVPGDFHGYNKDKAIADEWQKMSGDVEWIALNAECKNPGVPMRTTDEVHLREKPSTDSRSLEILAPETLVYAAGARGGSWLRVNVRGSKGYVNTEYLEFADGEKKPAVSGENKDTDTEKGGGDSGNGDSDKGTSGSFVITADGQKIPFQGAFSAMLYDEDGNSVLIRRGADFEWYSENGVSFGSSDYVDTAAIGTAGNPLVDENGKAWYWTYPPRESSMEKPDESTGGDTGSGDKIPFQGDVSFMVYGEDGSSVRVRKFADGFWYGDDGACYGSWDEVDDFLASGDTITNENGETYYRLMPQE